MSIPSSVAFSSLIASPRAVAFSSRGAAGRGAALRARSCFTFAFAFAFAFARSRSPALSFALFLLCASAPLRLRAEQVLVRPRLSTLDSPTAPRLKSTARQRSPARLRWSTGALTSHLVAQRR
jgi:hypothetical protein